MKVGTDTQILVESKLGESEKYKYYSATTLNIKEILAVANHNIKTTLNSLKYLVSCNKLNKNKEVDCLMYRLYWDIIPYFTCRYRSYLFKKNIVAEFAPGLKEIGKYARKHNIRLSFHAPMNCVLNSVKDIVLANSIYELNQLTYIFKLMGYNTNKWHPYGCTICTHCGSKEGGVKNYIKGFMQLSSEAKNFVAVENDTSCFSAKDLLPIADYCPIILDIHHNWLNTGKYLKSTGKTAKLIRKSWKKCTPKIHCSMPQKELLDGIYEDVIFKSKPEGRLELKMGLPNFNIINSVVSKQKLNKHSSYIWSKSIIDYCKEFDSDVMIEAQMCSLASLSFVVNC